MVVCIVPLTRPWSLLNIFTIAQAKGTCNVQHFFLENTFTDDLNDTQGRRMPVSVDAATKIGC